MLELSDIFFGSHQKGKSITPLRVRQYGFIKKARKSLITSGFFKKSEDIFFSTPSHERKRRIGVFFSFCLRERAKPSDPEKRVGLDAFNEVCHAAAKIPDRDLDKFTAAVLYLGYSFVLNSISEITVSKRY